MSAPPPQPPAPPFRASTPPPLPQAHAAALAGAERRGRGLGVVALILGLIAGIVMPLVGGIAAYAAGAGATPAGADGAPLSWEMFIPVREWLLVGEIAFWVGTALGMWTLTQGIVAVVRRRGTAAGAIGIIAAAAGPAVFALTVGIALAVALP